MLGFILYLFELYFFLFVENINGNEVKFISSGFLILLFDKIFVSGDKVFVVYEYDVYFLLRIKG